MMARVIELSLGNGSLLQGFPTVQVRLDDGSRAIGHLPAIPELHDLYRRWQTIYGELCQYHHLPARTALYHRSLAVEDGPGGADGEDHGIVLEGTGITHISEEDLVVWGEQIVADLNQWLKNEGMEAINQLLRSRLDPQEEILILLQTVDFYTLQLPWHLWDFCQDYLHAEVVLATLHFEPQASVVKTGQPLRVLLVLGDSTAIDVDADSTILRRSLPDAVLTVLRQPESTALLQHLNDPQGWDMLFFSGHSMTTRSQEGMLAINAQETISLDQLSQALQTAIEQGLQIAFFNSCEGLGLARSLSVLHIPYVVVMRELVPEAVAQHFLATFLRAFTRGPSLPLAVHEARQQLQEIEREFPGASWMPLICQNPAVPSLTWHTLHAPSPPAMQPQLALSREDYRIRQVLISKVKNFWINGVLEHSLHHRLWLNLRLESRPDAIAYPWELNLTAPGVAGQQLPPETQIIDVFDQLGMGKTLLILGEPGAGKTTTLLQLAKALLARASLDPKQVIPILFNLSSWDKRQSLHDWLVQELKTKYQVAPRIGTMLLQRQQLLLLLDGLDEVKPANQRACVVAINRFYQEFGETEMVVCSRTLDYELMEQRLGFHSAVEIHPLTDGQVVAYLQKVLPQLAEVAAVLPVDGELVTLIRSPLMLNVMGIALHNKSPQEIPHLSLDKNLLQNLFDLYIEQMFRHRRTRADLPRQQVIQWLSWLAAQMQQRSQSMFLIERIQATWLGTLRLKVAYRLGVALIVALLGFGNRLLLGQNSALQHLGYVKPYGGLFPGLAFALLLGVVYGIFLPREVKTAEAVSWSWETAQRHLWFWPLIGLSGGLMFHALVWLMAGPSAVPVSSSVRLVIFLLSGFIGLTSGLVYAITLGLGGLETNSTIHPNQGIRVSIKNALGMMVFGGLGAGILGGGFGLWLSHLTGFPGLASVELRRCSEFGMLLGFLGGGGLSCIQHFVIRCLGYWHGDMPWNYTRFLNDATDRIFLQRVGGGYIFIHRSLLDHFARMNVQPPGGKLFPKAPEGDGKE